LTPVEVPTCRSQKRPSVLHSFFGWAEAEDIIDADPSRKSRRPRKRRPEIYRPTLDELRRVRDAALAHERPAILLMEGVGLRRSEVVGCRWADLDLMQGRVHVRRKGGHWDRKNSAQASERSSPNLMTTCSPSRSSNGCLTIGEPGEGKTLRSRRAIKRSCGWSGESASGRGFVRSPLTSFDTASPIASSARAVATWSRCRR
jgi:integrase